jgi:hypothetical protein
MRPAKERNSADVLATYGFPVVFNLFGLPFCRPPRRSPGFDPLGITEGAPKSVTSSPSLANKLPSQHDAADFDRPASVGLPRTACGSDNSVIAVQLG